MMVKVRYLVLIYLLCFFILPPCNLHTTTPKKEKGPSVVLNGDGGFFAVFSCVLSVLDHYDKKDFSGVKIDFQSGLYLDLEKGPNWWEYYFEPIQRKDKKAKNAPYHILTGAEILHYTGLGFHVPRKRAYKLIKKYVHLKPDIKKDVKSFVKKNFKGHFVIGVHHRGTDKILEVPLVSYAKTLQALNDVIDGLSESSLKKLKIYVATDEQSFLNYMLSIYPSQIIHGNFVRSTDSSSLHGGSHHYANNYQKGKEALMECLLLSKCKVLIYPQSALSLASTKFNPRLKAIPIYGD